MELENTQGLRYHEVKKDISLITVLPDKLLDVPLLCKKVQEAIDFRKEMMELFKPFLLHQYPQLEGSDEQLKLGCALQSHFSSYSAYCRFDFCHLDLCYFWK